MKEEQGTIKSDNSKVIATLDECKKQVRENYVKNGWEDAGYLNDVAELYASQFKQRTEAAINEANGYMSDILNYESQAQELRHALRLAVMEIEALNKLVGFISSNVLDTCEEALERSKG